MDWIDRAVMSAYEPADGTGDDDQQWQCGWVRPIWGCDTLQHLVDELRTGQPDAPPPNDAPEQIDKLVDLVRRT